jgi:predicted nucleic acid-binding protein
MFISKRRRRNSSFHLSVNPSLLHGEEETHGLHRRVSASTHSEASRDPGDDYLIEAARTAAAVLVTGDKDLLDLDLEPPAAPREFLALLERGTEI